MSFVNQPEVESKIKKGGKVSIRNLDEIVNKCSEMFLDIEKNIILGFHGEGKYELHQISKKRNIPNKFYGIKWIN